MFAVVVLFLAAGWGYLFGYPAPPVNPDWELEAAETIPEGSVVVRYAGTSTLLFDDGDTAFMLDGWFSRPPPIKVFFSEIEPDLEAISYGLEAMEVDTLAAVLPVHSHYDHAMDTPEVALRTDAVVYGSEATANICRGWGFPEERIALLADGAPFQLGAFTITPMESKHFLFNDPAMVENMLTNSEIPEPLVPPASAFDYKLGKAYVFHIAHPKGSTLVIGSAGFIPGQLEGIEANVVFAGVGGIGSQTAEYRELYWEETIERVDPERLVLIHWDSLTGPIDQPMTGEVRIAGFLAAGAEETKSFLQAKADANPDLPFQTLPRFAPVVLFQ